MGYICKWKWKKSWEEFNKVYTNPCKRKPDLYENIHWYGDNEYYIGDKTFLGSYDYQPKSEDYKDIPEFEWLAIKITDDDIKLFERLRKLHKLKDNDN